MNPPRTPVITACRAVRSQAPGQAFVAAAETAPFLQRADVLLYGRAVGPGGAAVPRFGVRLLVSRDGQPLLDKRLVVQGPPDAAGNPTPVASQAIVWELAVGGPAYPENPTERVHRRLEVGGEYQFRREGETTWKVLRSGLTDSILVWDTTTVPNGTYFVRVVASDYDDAVASDPRIDRLRARMHVVENPQFTKNYYDAEKRFIGNAVQVTFSDGTQTERVEVSFPIGHRRRRDEGLPILEEKFRTSLEPRIGVERFIEPGHTTSSMP